MSLSPERLAAYVQVSRQSILQSKNVDVENFTRRDLTNAVRRGLDLAAINGSGSGDQPTGILNVSGVNDITIGTDGGPLTWALIVQFETETANDNADFGKLAYLTSGRGRLPEDDQTRCGRQRLHLGGAKHGRRKHQRLHGSSYDSDAVDAVERLLWLDPAWYDFRQLGGN